MIFVKTPKYHQKQFKTIKINQTMRKSLKYLKRNYMEVKFKFGNFKLEKRACQNIVVMERSRSEFSEMP